MNLEQSDSGHFLGDSGNMGTIRVDVLDPGIKVHIKKQQQKKQTCSASGHLSIGSNYATKQ